jgi:hypothetical protein
LAFLILFRSSFESDCIDVFDDGALLLWSLKRDRHLRDDEKIYLFVAVNATRSKLTLLRLFYSTTLLTGLISLVSSQTTLTFRVKKSGSRRNFVVNFWYQLSKTFLGTTKCSVSFPLVKLFKKFHKSNATRCANNSLLPLILASFCKHSSSGSKETPIEASS